MMQPMFRFFLPRTSKFVIDSRLIGTTNSAFKQKIDTSKYPVLEEKDIQEDFVKGSGPGGQSVNKTCNQCVLKHIPSGIIVRCHDTRSAKQNSVIARKRLLDLLDMKINGENSVSAQKEQILKQKQLKRDAKSRKNREMKLKAKLALENGIKSPWDEAFEKYKELEKADQ